MYNSTNWHVIMISIKNVLQQKLIVYISSFYFLYNLVPFSLTSILNRSHKKIREIQPIEKPKISLKIKFNSGGGGLSINKWQ